MVLIGYGNHDQGYRWEAIPSLPGAYTLSLPKHTQIRYRSQNTMALSLRFLGSSGSMYPYRTHIKGRPPIGSIGYHPLDLVYRHTQLGSNTGPIESLISNLLASGVVVWFVLMSSFNCLFGRVYKAVPYGCNLYTWSIIWTGHMIKYYLCSLTRNGALLTVGSFVTLGYKLSYPTNDSPKIAYLCVRTTIAWTLNPPLSLPGDNRITRLIPIVVSHGGPGDGVVIRESFCCLSRVDFVYLLYIGVIQVYQVSVILEVGGLGFVTQPLLVPGPFVHQHYLFVVVYGIPLQMGSCLFIVHTFIAIYPFYQIQYTDQYLPYPPSPPPVGGGVGTPPRGGVNRGRRIYHYSTHFYYYLTLDLPVRMGAMAIKTTGIVLNTDVRFSCQMQGHIELHVGFCWCHEDTLFYSGSRGCVGLGWGEMDMGSMRGRYSQGSIGAQGHSPFCWDFSTPTTIGMDVVQRSRKYNSIYIELNKQWVS
ncbi:hypothetical protein G9A89_000267, partial [Geosiphon pyriformis]